MKQHMPSGGGPRGERAREGGRGPVERTLSAKTFGVHPDSERKPSGGHFVLADVSAEQGVGVKGHR